MADPLPTPPPPTPPVKRTRGVINAKYVKEIKDARDVATAARHPDYTAALTKVALDPTLAPQALALADQLETALGKLISTRADKVKITHEEKTAREALLAIISPIQTAAKRKFKGDTTPQRAAYFIGGPRQLASQPLADVLTAARAILARLTPGENNVPPVEELPGITADDGIQKLRDAITLYDTTSQAQEEKQDEAGITLENLDTKIKALALLRHDLQLAAEQAFPWRTPRRQNHPQSLPPPHG